MASKRRHSMQNDDVKIVGINHGLCLAFNLYSEGWRREQFADVRFYCGQSSEHGIQNGPKKYLRANRSVLAAASPFFATILPDVELENDVCITTELTYEEMFAVLEYIYSGRLLCSNSSRMEKLNILKEFSVFVPPELQDCERMEEIEIIIEQAIGQDGDTLCTSLADDESEIQRGDLQSVHINLELEEENASLVLGPVMSYKVPNQNAFPSTRKSPSISNHYQISQRNIEKISSTPKQLSRRLESQSASTKKSTQKQFQQKASALCAVTQPGFAEELIDLTDQVEAPVTLSMPKQFLENSANATQMDLEKNQLKQSTHQPNGNLTFYPLSAYFAQTWCFGIYSPSEPDIRVFESTQYEDPLQNCKIQPFVHNWTSFKQPTYLVSRPKLVYERSEPSGFNQPLSQSITNKAILKLADICSMKTHKGKIHVTLNGEPILKPSLPQIFNETCSQPFTGQWSSIHQRARCFGRRSNGRAAFVSSENDEDDKIDLALSKHFLQEQVRRKQKLQMRIKMFTERLNQHKEIAREILQRKQNVQRSNGEVSSSRLHSFTKKSGPQTQCEQCGKMVLASRLKVHLKIHSGIKSHLCDLCGRAFLLKAYLNAHIRINHRQTDRPKRFMCSSCGYTCDQKHKLEVHERVHTDERPFECQYCDKRFREKGTLVRHIRTHTGERPYSCDLCGTSYAARDTYVQHYKRKHQAKSSAAGVAEPRQRTRQSNVVIYRCEFCQKGFYRLLAYEKHRATHTGVAAAVRCTQGDCDFTYSDMSQLKEHMRIVHPGKTYTCGICSKVFLTKQNLTNHQSKHDPNLGFHCSHCSLSLTTKASLIAHEKIHTRDKPYQCSFCGMCFHSPYLIKIHLRKHQPSHPKRKRSRRQPTEPEGADTIAPDDCY